MNQISFEQISLWKLVKRASDLFMSKISSIVLQVSSRHLKSVDLEYNKNAFQ